MTSYSENEKDWLTAFDQKIKKKSYDQFSIFILEWKTASTEQKEALGKILFVDHTSLKYWDEYISLCFNLFAETKKVQVQRLINKAIESFDEGQYNQDELFLDLYLRAMQLKT
jgi:hypothetical protein